MPEQRLDYAEAAKMLRAGATQQEVADHFGVGQAAVSRAIARGVIKGVEYDRTKTDESAIPWYPIRAEHRNRHLARMLRAAGRRERGEQSAEVVEAQLNLFLRSAKELDFVVHYDPDTEQGWFRVPRRKGIDTGLIRDPFKDDHGRQVVDPPNVRRRTNA